MKKVITVDANSLGAILQALVGPPHLIKELLAIRGLGDNPIDKLVEEFNQQISED